MTETPGAKAGDMIDAVIDQNDETATRDGEPKLEITVFKELNGHLSKRLELIDGVPKSDGSGGKMSFGTARRLRCRPSDLPALFEGMACDEAIALGRVLGAPGVNKFKVVIKAAIVES